MTNGDGVSVQPEESVREAMRRLLADRAYQAANTPPPTVPNLDPCAGPLGLQMPVPRLPRMRKAAASLFR